jgi:hypothetical protein
LENGLGIARYGCGDKDAVAPRQGLRWFA